MFSFCSLRDKLVVCLRATGFVSRTNRSASYFKEKGQENFKEKGQEKSTLPSEKNDWQ